MTPKPDLFADRTKAWSDFIRKIRRHFERRSFIEVSTSYIVESGAMENNLDPIQVHWSGGKGELHTSPEFQMKIVLSKLRCPIYQICKSFRDDPITPIHLKEFHMLEFYVPEIGVKQLEALTCDLISYLSPVPIEFHRISLAQHFITQFGIDWREHEDLDSFKKVINQKGLVTLSPQDQWDDVFFKIMLEKVEPTFTPEKPTIVTDYPANQSILSVLNSHGYADRFEIYWKGMELCNGCEELNKRTEAEARIELENTKRIREGKPAHLPPAALLEVIEKVPKASGVAIGLDRLFQAVSGYPFM